jgi:LTXXQ motif family protein
MPNMTRRWSKFAVAATVAALALPVSIPLSLALAQTQAPPPSQTDWRSPEVRARLFDGRMAMIKESLKLSEPQLALWGPVEAQLRTSFEARQKAREERHARRRGGGERTASALPDRLDRASQRATERAERLKGLAETFRPFYASLSDDQRAVAGMVLRPALSDRGPGPRRWHLRRAARPQEL